MNRAQEHDPKAKSDVCPKCGGRLIFNRAPGGSGQTVEQCENLRLSTVRPGLSIGSCDHWTLLEPMRRGAHLAPPRGEQRQPTGHARVALRSVAVRSTTARQLERVAAALSPHRAEARTRDEIARALGMSENNAYRLLELLVIGGRAGVALRRTGRPRRQPKEYWAIAKITEAA